jgi:hypothetical protein
VEVLSDIDRALSTGTSAAIAAECGEASAALDESLERELAELMEQVEQERADEISSLLPDLTKLSLSGPVVTDRETKPAPPTTTRAAASVLLNAPV